jgi:hypothetical protein
VRRNIVAARAAETFKDASVATEFHAEVSVHEDRQEAENGASSISITAAAV